MLLTLWTIKLKTSSLSTEKVEGPNNCNKNQIDLKKEEAFTERNRKKVYLMVTYLLVLNTTIPLIG